MITFKQLVSAFFLSLIVPLCVCYGLTTSQSASDDLTTVKDPERYYTQSEIGRFEEMFKTGKINLEYHSLDQGKVLHYAALKGNLDWVKRIVERGADVNEADRYDRTPLLFAVMSGNLTLVEYLAEQGADVNAKDDNEKTALHFAAEIGSLELVKWLAEKGLDVNAKEIDYPKKSVLLYAVESDSLELVQWLVKRGADVNVTDVYCENALQYAVRSSSLEMIQWLVEQGLDVNVLDGHGNTLLFRASHRGSLEIVQWLFDQGLDVNAVSRNGYTPLLVAAASRFPKLVKWLVERGADVNVKDGAGLSVLFFISSNHWISVNDKQDLFSWLNEHGADLKKDGFEPLMSSALLGDLPLVKWLVEQGVDVNSASPNHITALHCAARSGNLDLVQWLIDQGADVNAQSDDEDTALTNACDSDFISMGTDHLKMVQLLVKHGAIANPNLGKKLCPYWIELWRQQSKSTKGVNYPLIRYLMFNDKGLIIVFSAIIMTVVVASLFLGLIKRAKKNDQIETA